MANSINTNSGALIALQNLNATNRDLGVTQNRINTGLKVNSAKDNGAIWAIAQSQRAEMGSLNAVKESLQRGQSTIDVAMAAGNQISDILLQMKEKALAASDQGLSATNRKSLETDYQELAKQITTVVDNASFNGVNMLKGATAPVAGASVTALVNAKGGTQKVDGVNMQLDTAGINLSATTLFSGGADAAADATLAKTASAAVDTAIEYVSGKLTALGTGSKGLDNMLSFTSKLQDALETGIGNLVDADLAKESARLQSLQTKQQLGVQALSIANQSSSVLLSLFR